MYKLNLLTESEIGELGIMKAFMYVYVIINDKWSTHCLQGFELENLYKKKQNQNLYHQNLYHRIWTWEFIFYQFGQIRPELIASVKGSS